MRSWLDGIIYETFEPGIGAFAAQIEKLGGGMLAEPVSHEPDALEIACDTHASAFFSPLVFSGN
jgi:hypothetical protein